MYLAAPLHQLTQRINLEFNQAALFVKLSFSFCFPFVPRLCFSRDIGASHQHYQTLIFEVNKKGNSKSVAIDTYYTISLGNNNHFSYV